MFYYIVLPMHFWISGNPMTPKQHCFSQFRLLVVTTPPSPDVIVFNGCKEKVDISACLHEPTLKNFY